MCLFLTLVQLLPVAWQVLRQGLVQHLHQADTVYLSLSKGMAGKGQGLTAHGMKVIQQDICASA